MDHTFGTFLHSDSTESQAAMILSAFRAKLEAISSMFEYKKSPREITQKNLISLENEVREILGEIINSPSIRSQLISTDAVRRHLNEVKTNLSLAADICDMPKTISNRKKLYACYSEINKFIHLAIDSLPSNI